MRINAGTILLMEASNDNHRKCPHCGANVTGRRDKVYCSATCKYAAKNVRIERDHTKRIAMTCVCGFCGAEFHPKKSDRTSFCSRECDQAKRKADAAARPPETKLSYYTPKPKKEVMCACCGASFLTSKPNAKYCGPACVATAAVAANDNVDRAPRPCAECGKEFSPAYGSKRRKFCCTECGQRNTRRAAKAARRANERGAESEKFDPIEVLNRDGWHCMECGIETPRELRGTWLDNAPELDHIIPQARGGPHTRANTRCLCRKCNGEKSDRLLAA